MRPHYFVASALLNVVLMSVLLMGPSGSGNEDTISTGRHLLQSLDQINEERESLGCPPCKIDDTKNWCGMQARKIAPSRDPNVTRLEAFLKREIHDLEGTNDEFEPPRGAPKNLSELQVTYFDRFRKVLKPDFDPSECNSMLVVVWGHAKQEYIDDKPSGGTEMRQCMALVERAKGTSYIHTLTYQRPKFVANTSVPGFALIPRDSDAMAVARFSVLYAVKQAYLRYYYEKFAEMQTGVSAVLEDMWAQTDVAATKASIVWKGKLSGDHLWQMGRTKAAQKVALEGRSVVLIALSYGHMPLLLNWLCSLDQSGVKRPPLLVIAGSPSLRDTLMSMGIAAYYHRALAGVLPESFMKGSWGPVGSFNLQDMFQGIPDEAAVFLGDKTWTRSMFLKTAAVHLVMQCGYNVLFQDADLVWFRNPLEYFHRVHTESSESKAPEDADKTPTDTFWMFDGNRDIRFEPFYPNTGFFFLHNTLRSVALWDQLLSKVDLIMQYGSQQATLAKVLSSLYADGTVTVQVLHERLFTGGRAFLNPPSQPWMRETVYRRKELIAAGQAEKLPYVMHMHWTNNASTKLTYFRTLGLWFFQGQEPQCQDILTRSKNPNAPKPNVERSHRTKSQRSLLQQEEEEEEEVEEGEEEKMDENFEESWNDDFAEGDAIGTDDGYARDGSVHPTSHSRRLLQQEIRSYAEFSQQCCRTPP